MKILIVTARYFPEQFSITNIAEKMVNMGHDITVLTGVPHYGYGSIFEGYENVRFQIINGVKVYRVREIIRKNGVISLMRNYGSIFYRYKQFLRHHKVKYDAIISHVISPIFTLRAANYYATKHKIPHIHYGLDLWPESLVATYYLKRKSIFFDIVKKYSRHLYSKCDLISFSSPSAESYFHEYLDLPQIPFRHIYQPCLTTMPPRDDIDHHVFRQNGKTNLLYCGTIGKFHRIDLIIEAISQFEGRNKLKFHIIGSGSELDNIKKLVEEKKLSDVVNFYGRIPASQTVKHYLTADILYVPLINNSCTSLLIPQKAIEYLMYGRPILGMLVGDGAEIIKKASSDNIICDQTLDALIASLTKLCNADDEVLVKCGISNRLFFESEDRFKIDIVCRELVDTCTELEMSYRDK